MSDFTFDSLSDRMIKAVNIKWKLKVSSASSSSIVYRDISAYSVVNIDTEACVEARTLMKR